MRYFVTIGETTHEVDLSGERPRVDGREVVADLVTVPGTLLRHLLLDGRSYPLVARRLERGSWELLLDGARLNAEVLNERARAVRALEGQGGAAHGPRPVRAPMPGLVTRVEVVAGETVVPGQGVAIIEAMKMENELRAEAVGVVARVLVTAGQAVEKGAVLVEFAADQSGSAGQKQL